MTPEENLAQQILRTYVQLDDLAAHCRVGVHELRADLDPVMSVMHSAAIGDVRRVEAIAAVLGAHCEALASALRAEAARIALERL